MRIKLRHEGGADIKVSRCMELRFKWNMFFTSFIPLWIAIITSDVFSIINHCRASGIGDGGFSSAISSFLSSNRVSLFMIFLILALLGYSVCSINSLLRDERENDNPGTIKIVKAEKGGGLSSEYLVAYILPMIAFDFDSLEGVVLFAIYFFILAYLCIRNNNVYVNILFEIKGYRIYVCDLETINMGNPHTHYNCLVISRNNLLANEDCEMRCYCLGDHAYIDVQ